MGFSTRPVWVDIDHQAICRNFRAIRGYLPIKVQIMGVVKADAYGHGAREISQTLQSCGIDRLAVAMPEEARPLRESGITIPIHVLGEILPEQYPLIPELSLTQTIARKETLEGLGRYLAQMGLSLPVHLKCDTGMGRLGPLPSEIPDRIRYAKRFKSLKVEGLMTHLARADEADRAYSLAQCEQFQDLIRLLASRGMALPLYHMANSPGLCQDMDFHLNMVRPGIMLYGMQPSAQFSPPFDLTPALTWKARIVHMKTIPSGSGISYSTVYHTPKQERIAVLPLGYADGFRRSLSDRGEVLVRGKRARVRGRVCMDQVMIGVDHIPDARVGDEVVIIGSQGREAISAEWFARKAEALNYDAACAISGRVPRRHINRDP